MWVVWDGRQSRWILEERASSMTSIDVCEAWPSWINKTRQVGGILAMKNLNHSRYSSYVTQPLPLQWKLVPGTAPSLRVSDILSNEALHSEQRDGERLSRVVLNLCMFSEVICNWFTEDAYLPCVMCTVFGFACWLAGHSSWLVLIFMKPKRRCTSVASAMSLLISVEKKTWLIGCFLDRGDRQPAGLLSLTMLQLLDQPTFSSSGSPKLITDQIRSL